MTQWKAGYRAMTEAEAAMVDAGLVLRNPMASGLTYREARHAHEIAADVVLAERAPPDPVEVAMEFFAARCANGKTDSEAFRAALKVYDAALVRNAIVTEEPKS